MPIDIVNVGKNAMDVRKSVALTPYSKIIINVAKGNNSDEVISFIAGDDTGTTLEFDCPWGTQQMAEDLLAKMNGYQYQPYEATGAITNPAVEMGDAVQVNGIYGGVYTQDSLFTHTFFSDFSAPQDEQLDHEFTYESPIERRLTRQEAYSKATFKIQHEDIEAKVSKEGGYQESESFSWKLLSDKFQLYAGTKAVFTCNKGGITVDGTIKARSGYIGTDANGFNIGDKAIWNGKSTIGASSVNQKDGVYVGTDGIALGRVNVGTSSDPSYADAFSVSNNGTFTARKGYIGNGSSGFNISNSAIYNGTSDSSSTSQGVYVGTRAIRSYYDSVKNFTFNATNGTLTICVGMTGVSDITHTTGAFFGNDGIALGGGKFKVTSGGALTATSATITGTIRAKDGRIGATSADGTSGGFILTGNKFYTDGKTSYSSNADGVYVGTDGIGLGQAKFYVTSAGKLTATDASVTGYIKATSGEFAGELKAATGTFKGDLSACGGTFKGELSAATGSFSGQITASSGYIGGSTGFTIQSTSIHNGKSSIDNCDNASGVYIGTDGISLGRKNIGTDQSPSWVDAFKVDSSGNLTARNGTFGGTIYASKLTFTNEDGTTYTLSASNLTDGTITSGKIGSGEIAETNIANSAVSDNKISNVNGSKLNGSSVPSSKFDTSTKKTHDHGGTAYEFAQDLQATTTKVDSIRAGKITASDYISVKDIWATMGSSTSHKCSWIEVTTGSSTAHVIGYI